MAAATADRLPTDNVTQPSTFKSKLQSLNLTHMLAGSIAGMTARFILQPLDLVKVRLQVQDGTGAAEYKSIRHALTSIVRDEGVTGLYRGMSANLIGAGMSWGSYFFFYTNLKDIYRRHLAASDKAITPTTKLSAPAHLGCAAASGVCTVLITNPIVMIKTRLQLQGLDRHNAQAHYTNPFNALTTIVREEGVLSLYRGIGPSLLLVSNGALQFMAYEELKKFVGRHVVADESMLQPQHYLLMGGTAKLFSATLTYPLALCRSRLYAKNSAPAAQLATSGGADVSAKMKRPLALCRSRLYAKNSAPAAQLATSGGADVSAKMKRPSGRYTGFSDVIAKTYVREGVLGFYKGLSVQLIKTAPSSALTFTIYEMTMRLLKGREATK